MARNRHVTGDALLEVKLHEFLGTGFSIGFDTEEVLFEAVDQNDIDSLAVEKLCEEGLDGLAEVEHSGLLHDYVHRFEHKVLV